MKHLVAQGESKQADGDRYYGFSLYEEGGVYFAIYHCRVYEPGALRVEHKHDTGRVAMEATTEEVARDEVITGYRAFVGTYGVGVK